MDAAAPPYRVSDSTPEVERVALLDTRVEEGLADGLVCRAAWLVLEGELGVARTQDLLARQRRGAPMLRADTTAVTTALLRYVQREVGYRPDPEGEWHQGSVYTLAHGGDCEDLAVLLVAMLRCVGLGAAVVWYTVPPPAVLNHVTVRVDLGDGAGVFAEPSVYGAFLGEDPWDAATRTAQTERLGTIP